MGTAVGLLAALEVLARLHGAAPATPRPGDASTLEVVRLAAPAPVRPTSRPAPDLAPAPSRPHEAARSVAAPSPAPAPDPVVEPAPAVTVPAPVAAETAPPPREESPSPPAPPAIARADSAAAPTDPSLPRADAAPAESAPARPIGREQPSPPLVAAQSLDPGFQLTAPLRPRYPGRARKLGRPGAVDVEVEVAPDGRVTGLAVHDRTPGWGFGAAAREAFARARFTPPRVNGEPVRVRWRKTLLFRP